MKVNSEKDMGNEPDELTGNEMAARNPPRSSGLLPYRRRSIEINATFSLPDACAASIKISARPYALKRSAQSVDAPFTRNHL
ncbi:hypothetical protein GCM10011385_25820 [Nitratireductor aestuarii]|uniref:Uncharacterized protein n=1 Tax=Nitratireductor aestuarii TaxID=1735103 RepID=A0A916W6D2_9HYPH|nr:hypothetical protein GCM10011385_25820 [Nitratireductor aestuarii]